MTTQSLSAINRFLAYGQSVDARLFEAAYNRRGRKSVDGLMWLLSRSGDGPLYVALALLLYVGQAPRLGAFLTACLVAFGIERTCYLVLKNLFRRARPFTRFAHVRQAIDPMDRYSFPSGHAAASCVMATLIAGFYPPFGLPAYLYSYTVAYSRIYNGIHYPADVVAGLLLGYACARLALVVVL
jgi:undecaprenyl-diphosphatase